MWRTNQCGETTTAKRSCGEIGAKKETATLLEKRPLLWALFLARKTDPENVDNETLRGVGEGAPKLGLRGNLPNTPLTR
jgi:hypothetical protein